jgi:hypothetical protein
MEAETNDNLKNGLIADLEYKTSIIKETGWPIDAIEGKQLALPDPSTAPKRAELGN